MSKTPLLILSDSISCSSGLGRISRDLALRLHQNCSDVFEIGTCGYGGPGDIFPFPEFHLHSVDKWLAPELPIIWERFVGDREGILFAIWDASRLYWLTDPAQCPIPFLARWLEAVRSKMKNWAYPAIDAEGPNGKLTHRIAEIYKGFDRVLDYSAFSCAITGNKDHLPHGIDPTIFNPKDRSAAKKAFREGGFATLNDDSLLIGIVATNQARKDWALGMEAASILAKKGYDVRLWCHTDIMERHWNIPSLVVDFGLSEKAAVTTSRFTDEQMVWMYSACDITFGIGPEGWGLPLCESLACGTPVITGKYGAQVEYVPERLLVKPVAFRYEGPYCSRRPVYDPRDWADKAEAAYLESKQVAQKTLLPSWVEWDNAWKSWQAWFLEGVL